VIAESFARIHKANLVNFGILPLEFVDPADRQRFKPGDKLALAGLHQGLKPGGDLQVENQSQGFAIKAKLDLSQRQCEVLKAGGTLAWTAAKLQP
jgi:aconitate hydratase